MGTDAHVIVRGPADLARRARALIEELEQRWSRFIPSSELSMLNRAAGTAVTVSPETLLLVARSLQAWERTDGLFDPSVHDALVAAGYDRDFDELEDGDVDRPHAGVPGCAGVAIDAATSTVHLPAGVHLDPGGIGKGLAADLAAAALRAAGAEGVCVNLGGDLRAAGRPADGPDWRIDITHPVTGDLLAQLGIADGAVATSSPLKRAWWHGAERRHHLIDPHTGHSARTAVAVATVVAAEGWLAEAFAKTAVLSGTVARGLARLSASGISGVLIDTNGDVHVTRDLGGVVG